MENEWSEWRGGEKKKKIKKTTLERGVEEVGRMIPGRWKEVEATKRGWREEERWEEEVREKM